MKQILIEEDSIQEVEDLMDLTNKELLILLKERGLNASRASKPELIKRLKSAIHKGQIQIDNPAKNDKRLSKVLFS